MPHHPCAQRVTSDFFLSQAFTPLPAAWAKGPGRVCHHKPGRQITHFRQHLPEHNKRSPSPVPKTASEQKANTVFSENGFVCWVIVSWACCTQSSIHFSILMWGLAGLCLIADFCPAQPVPMLHSYPPFSVSKCQHFHFFLRDFWVKKCYPQIPLSFLKQIAVHLVSLINRNLFLQQPGVWNQGVSCVTSLWKLQAIVFLVLPYASSGPASVLTASLRPFLLPEDSS